MDVALLRNGHSGVTLQSTVFSTGWSSTGWPSAHTTDDHLVAISLKFLLIGFQGQLKALPKLGAPEAGVFNFFTWL